MIYRLRLRGFLAGCAFAISTWAGPDGHSAPDSDDRARKNVASQMAIEEIQSRLEAARKLAESGQYEEALNAFEAVRELLRRSPNPKATASLEAECVRGSQETREKLRKAEADLKLRREQQADEVLAEARKKAGEARRLEAQRLLERAYQAYDAGSLGECARLCNQVLSMQPGDAPAASLKLLALRDEFQGRLERAAASGERAREDLQISILEAQTPPPPGQVMTYPSAEEWKRLSARRLRYRQARPQKPPEPWELEIEKTLQKPLSFEFQDTPLQDVVDFLQNATGVNMVLDRSAVRDADRPISLRVQGMKAKSALEWVVKLVGLEYALQNEAIFISSRARLKKAMPEMRVYDFEDFISSRPDFRNRKQEVAEDWIEFLKKAVDAGGEAETEQEEEPKASRVVR